VFTTARHRTLSLSHEQAESSPQPAILTKFHLNITNPSLPSHPKLSLNWNFKKNSAGLCGYHISNLQVLSISNFWIFTSFWHLMKSNRRVKFSTATVFSVWYMIYMLTAIGYQPGGSNTVHIYTQTIHRTTQNKQYIEQHKNWRVWAVPHLCGFHPEICLTTEAKARKNISQGSRRVPAGTMKTHKHTIRT